MEKTITPEYINGYTDAFADVIDYLEKERDHVRSLRLNAKAPEMISILSTEETSLDAKIEHIRKARSKIIRGKGVA